MARIWRTAKNAIRWVDPPEVLWTPFVRATHPNVSWDRYGISGDTLYRETRHGYDASDLSRDGIVYERPISRRDTVRALDPARDIFPVLVGKWQRVIFTR